MVRGAQASDDERKGFMRGIAIRWLTLTAAILMASYLIGGIHVDGFFTALSAAAMLGILNAFFRPVALILTLPINILTFGLFTFVINALMLKMASGVIDGFEVHGFWTAVFGALVISVVSFALNTLISDKGRVDIIDLKHKGGHRWE
jgi:putative membrane protein